MDRQSELEMVSQMMETQFAMGDGYGTIEIITGEDDGITEVEVKYVSRDEFYRKVLPWFESLKGATSRTIRVKNAHKVNPDWTETDVDFYALTPRVKLSGATECP